MERIAQRYERLRELGTGGTAVVYEARDHVLNRPCAVKLLLQVGDGASADARSMRLRQEAAALAALDHPRVVRVYDLGEHEEMPFLAMEFVPGGSLADRLLATGPFGPTEAVDRMLEVLEALDAAHGMGIVHRDVKPHNVLLREDGTAALCDFGIARLESQSHTRTGVALGSVDYMAPEQRVDARRVGPSADVYGVGCTLFHILTGETPVDLYLAPDHSPRWEAVPAPLRVVLRRATAVDPADRHQTVAELAEELRQVRPALQGIPARRFLPLGTPSPMPTRVPTASGDRAPTSERVAVVVPRQSPTVGTEEWGWAAGKGPHAGRTTVGIAFGAAALMVLAAAVGWPMLEERLVARARVEAGTDVAPAGPASVAGRWQGSFGGAQHGGRLALEQGAEGTLTGQLVLDLDGNALRSGVSGRYVPETGHVWLEAPDAELSCDVDGFGVCRGTLVWQGRVVPFAVVRISD